MIEIHNLEKSFGRLKVLDNVSATLNKGDCIALIGPNGCGKTTLIKSILGMVLPDRGGIKFDGKNIARDESYRSHIGYMPQIGRYPDSLTIGQLIAMMRDIRREQIVPDEELIERFRLKEMFGKKMSVLSGGTTQKVSATLAFMFNPAVLFLDEPTAGLDPLAAEILKEKIVAERRKGKLIVITSHLLSELDDMVTRVAFMHEGKIMFNLSVEELLEFTGEQKISRAIAGVLKQKSHVSYR